jgi:hypothetical protein
MRLTGTALTGVLSAVAWLAWPRPALAGMPVVMLSDLARVRFQVVSFFLLVLLLCAWAVQAIWNALRADVPGLPRLSYGKAVGVITLWGLLFVLVLTMISGARELMTPGAWKKQGFTYKLADEPAKPGPATAPEPSADAGALERREQLDRLRAALWRYALAHDGRFPPGDDGPEIAREVWQVPEPLGLRYLYVAGRSLGEPDAIVAYEPGVYGRDRYVLLADGRVRLMAVAEIRKALEPERFPDAEGP